MDKQLYRATPAGLAAREAAEESEANMPEEQAEIPEAGDLNHLRKIPGESPAETAALDAQEKKTKGEDLSYLFEVPQEDDHDIYTDDLVEFDTEDLYGGSPDMSDLTTVTPEQMYGAPLRSAAERKAHKRNRNLQKLRRKYGPPPPSVSGMR